MTNFNPLLLADFYKVGHKSLYPDKTSFIYLTLTPRSNKHLPLVDKVLAWGWQGFIKEWLVDYFNDNFFNANIEDILNDYVNIIKNSLGVENPDVAHIEALHELGYLPIRIFALPEGTLVPIKTPILAIENTHPDFFWLTNYLETLISTELWHPITVASIAYEYRKTAEFYAKDTCDNMDHIQWQMHDFSLRGQTGMYAGAKAGAGHLLSFTGTDTVPSIQYLQQYYNAEIHKELIGGSITATEHSIQCSHMPESGLEDSTFEWMIERNPNGLLSVVSDTYDFWDNVTRVLPKLKSQIMSRDGKLVIRPDSGNPIHILCGYPAAETEHERKGLIECLWETFGGTINSKGYKVLDSHIGAIYGDSITLDRADKILQLLACKGFASSNVVLGVGSYSYLGQLSRDSLGFAIKATHAVINGEEKMLFKDPKTDDGTKRSQRGRVVVVDTTDVPLNRVSSLNKDGSASAYSFEKSGINFIDGLTVDTQSSWTGKDLLQPVFENGKLLRETTLAEIRHRLHGDNF